MIPELTKFKQQLAQHCVDTTVNTLSVYAYISEDTTSDNVCKRITILGHNETDKNYVYSINKCNSKYDWMIDGLIIDNDWLETIDADYRVALLDAKKDCLSVYNAGQVYDVDIIGCLAFFNKAGQCFLVLPCENMPRYMNFDKLPIPVIESTVDQINYLLQLWPLRYKNKYYFHVFDNYVYRNLPPMSHVFTTRYYCNTNTASARLTDDQICLKYSLMQCAQEHMQVKWTKQQTIEVNNLDWYWQSLLENDKSNNDDADVIHNGINPHRFYNLKLLADNKFEFGTTKVEFDMPDKQLQQSKPKPLIKPSGLNYWISRNNNLMHQYLATTDKSKSQLINFYFDNKFIRFRIFTFNK